MSVIIHYKYDIGDKVKLLESPDDVFTIEGWGWTRQEANNPFPYSHRKGQEDNTYKLRYDDKFWDNDLDAIGENHPHDEAAVLISTDNREIRIGMKVYGAIYQKFYKTPLQCNLNFSFAGYGTVSQLWYYKEKYNVRSEVKTKREFLTTFEGGTERHDAGGKGFENTYHSYEVTVEIPENYAEQYVNEMVNDKMSYDNLEPSCASWKRYEVDQWLKFIGVYDQVMKLYAEKKTAGECPYLHELEEKEQQKKKETSDKLKALLTKLTDEEKEELKKML